MSKAADAAHDLLNSEATSQLLADVAALSKKHREGTSLNKLGVQVAPSGQETRADVEPFVSMPRVSKETRVVDPKTGGAKGSKLARYDLIPWDAVELLAEHYGRGAFKYADRNWEKGYAWGLSFAALQRHLTAHWNGEVYDLDPFLYGVKETGDGPQPTMTPMEIEALPDDQKVLHITAVMWHAAALTAFFLRGIGTDDRPAPR